MPVAMKQISKSERKVVSEKRLNNAFSLEHAESRVSVRDI